MMANTQKTDPEYEDDTERDDAGDVTIGRRLHGRRMMQQDRESNQNRVVNLKLKTTAT